MAKTGRGRIAPVIALAALMLSVLAPMAAFADAHEAIGPKESFPAPDNASETMVCAALRDHLGFDSGVTVDAERVEWPPEEQTAQTDQLDGFSYIVLKSGQVYEYFDFTPDGYAGQLLQNGDATDFNISNITGCSFGVTPRTDVDVVVSKSWIDGSGDDVSWPSGFTIDVQVELFASASGEASGDALDSDTLTLSAEDLSLTTTFPDLVDGDEYVIAWKETAVSMTGSTAGCKVETSIGKGSEAFTAGTDDEVLIDAVNLFDCEPDEGEEPESVTVGIEKAWVGVGADEVGISPEFEVTLGDLTRTIGVDGTTTFDDLVDGESYTVAWKELTGALLPAFENEAGQTCVFALDESTTEGSETFIAGAVDSLTFDAVNLYSCGDAEVLISIPVQVDKFWATADGHELDAPGEAAVTFTVDLYDGDDLIDTVEGLAPGDSHLFEKLPQEGDYSVEWTEEGAPATITVGDLSCAIHSADGETVGSVDEGFTIAVTNLYECEEPVEEAEVEKLGKTETRARLPETGVSAILLGLMGLFGVGLGGGMIRLGRREG